MRGYGMAAAAWLAGSACSGSAEEGDGARAASSGDGAACGATTEMLPLTPAQPAPTQPAPGVDGAVAEASPYVTFVDCTTGFRSDEVFDADREIVRFDSNLQAMVAASGDRVGGWTVDGADLDWARSGVNFRVRFGTEAGERRAYFTEAGPGTICNLNVAGPDVLFISATSETPPDP